MLFGDFGCAELVVCIAYEIVRQNAFGDTSQLLSSLFGPGEFLS